MLKMPKKFQIAEIFPIPQPASNRCQDLVLFVEFLSMAVLNCFVHATPPRTTTAVSWGRGQEAYLYTYQPIDLSIYLSICLSTHLSIHRFFCFFFWGGGLFDGAICQDPDYPGEPAKPKFRPWPAGCQLRPSFVSLVVLALRACSLGFRM